MTMSYLGGVTDAERFELTRRKMDAIRAAILGTTQPDAQGHRASFGYHGDMGGLPDSLQALTAPQSPAWAFVATYGFGVGWRGPYYHPDFPDSYGLTTDGWGNAFVYSTTSLTSLGKDGLAGGAVFNTDLILNLGTATRLSRVRGVVKDGALGLDNQTVRLFYPAAGAIATASAVSNSNGFFFIDNIPFGARAVLVTNPPGLGPKPAFVDAPEVFLAPDTLNFQGAAQKLTVNTSSAGCLGAADKFHHNVDVTSSYLTAVTAGYITVWWENTSRRLNTIMLNGVSETLTAATSGTRLAITKNLYIPAGGTCDLELRWSSKADTMNVGAAFEWNGVSDLDQIAWITSACANPAIAVTNPQSANFNSGVSSTTMAYTVPSGITDLTLVVMAGGTSTDNNIRPSSATFNGSAMNLSTAVMYTNGSTRTAMGMFWLGVSAGASGNVVVTYPGSASDHTVHAYTLTNTQQAAPEAVVVKGGNAVITTSLLTLTDDALIVTGAEVNTKNTLAPTGSVSGPVHVVDSTNGNNNISSAMGHIPVSNAMNVQNSGFSAAAVTNMVLIEGSFQYKP
jgi:hypothetical protein